MIDYLEPYRQWCGQLKPTSKGGYLALCPSHNDTKPSLHINPKNGTYLHKCFSCDESGDSFIVANDYLSLSDSSDYAIHRIKKQKIKPYSNGIPLQNSTKKEATDLIPDSIVKEYNATLMDKPQLCDWGISPKTMKDFLLGYDTTQKKIVIPIPNGSGSYYTIKAHKGFQFPDNSNKENKFFPFDKIKKYDKKKTLFICGGEKDCIVGTEHLKHQFATVTGGENSEPTNKGYWTYVNGFATYIVIYDNDETGRKGAVKIGQAILRYNPTAKVLIAQWGKSLPDKWDIAEAVKQDKLETIHQAIDNAIDVEPPLDGGMMAVGNHSEQRINETKEVEELEHMSFGQLLQSGFKAPKIIIHEILQEKSVSLIGGCSGIGKSWIGLNLAICIANGRPLFNHFAVERPRKVLLAQFELDNGQVLERCKLLTQNMSDDEIKKTSENFDYIILKDNQAFSDRWDAIDNKLSQGSWDVLIVDNLYTSVDTQYDLSNNQHCIEVVAKIDKITEKHSIATSIITHHKKGLKKTQIDMDDILGGATLTRYCSNVFQIKNSLRDTDWRVSMITKVRGEESHLVEIPFVLKFKDGWFEKGDVISNETLHYLDEKERWEIAMVKDMKDYQKNDREEWTRKRLWKFLSTQKGWEQTPSHETKVTRFITKCMSWSLLEKVGHNNYIITDSDLMGS